MAKLIWIWIQSGQKIWIRIQWIWIHHTGSKSILVILKLNTCKNRFKRHSHTHTKKHTKTSPVKHRPAKVTLLYKVLKDHRLLLRKMQCRHKKTTPNFLLSIDILLHDSKSTFAEVFTSTYLAKVDVKLIFNQKNASKKCHPTNNFPFLLASFEEIAFFLLQFSFSFREFSFHIFSFQSEFFPIFTSIFRHMCEYSSDLHISCVLCHLIWQIFYWIQEIRAFYLHACIQKSLNLWYNGLIIS